MKHTSVESLLGTMRGIHEGTIPAPDNDEATDYCDLVIEAHDIMEGTVDILKDNPDTIIA